MKRLEILNTLDTELKKIKVANGYLTTLAVVQYNDDSPTQYEDRTKRVEITYRITDFVPAMTNRTWEWSGTLEVCGYIYNDRTPLTECQVQADILKCLGSIQSLGGMLRFINIRTGQEPSMSEGVVAGVSIQKLTLNFSIKWTTNMWEG